MPDQVLREDSEVGLGGRATANDLTITGNQQFGLVPVA
jgi:hypothetical protein